MAGLRQLIISAFCLVMGFLFIILACTVVKNKNAWPLISLVLFCFAPLPFFLCGRGSGSDDFEDDDEPLDAFNTIGLFIGGILVAAGPGVAIVFYHTAVTSGSALILTLLSAVCFVAAALSLAMTGDDGEAEEDDGYDF